MSTEEDRLDPDAPAGGGPAAASSRPRRPYWIEPGQTQSFTAQQRIAIWGELEAGASGGGSYDGARLRLQGIEWAPRDGQIVRISQQNGQAVLDSLSRTNAGTTG